MEDLVHQIGVRVGAAAEGEAATRSKMPLGEEPVDPEGRFVDILQDKDRAVEVRHPSWPNISVATVMLAGINRPLARPGITS